MLPVDRARACLLGMAVGDALGAPLEGLSAQQIQYHYGQGVSGYVDGALAWKKKPYRWRMPGLYSDDTQQALALADVLLSCGRVDVDRLATLYIELANPRGNYLGAHRGAGRSFREVLTALEGGTPPALAGSSSAGIGAAMRIAPVALYYVDEPDKLFEAVMAASLMTHRDVRSLAGAMAVALAVRLLAEGVTKKPSFLLRLAGDLIKIEERIAEEYRAFVLSLDSYRHSMSTAIALAERQIEDNIPRVRALSALVEEANKQGAEPNCKRATQGFPPVLIPTCLYLLVTTESFEEALVEAINLGGDADTAGAILGAMAGAHYGLAAIPDRWLAGLQNRTGIVLRAEALAMPHLDHPVIPDLVTTERFLSESEGACREWLLKQRQSGGDLGANRRV
jgi:ADP-ribosylglycohydrolase